MSTNTDQTTLEGQRIELEQTPDDISGLARIVWMVGSSDEFTGTVDELREVHRRAVELDLLEGER